jgi:hypothetical protein
MHITEAQLAQLIAADPQAAELYRRAQFADCAARCREIAPRVYQAAKLSRIGILNLYPTNPNVAVSILEAIEAAAANNRLFREVYSFMAPGTAPEQLPDFGLQPIRAALIAPQSVGGIGLTAEQAGPILAAGEQPDNITALDVERLPRGTQWQQ